MVSCVTACFSLAGVRFVVEDMEKAGAELQEVDVAGDRVVAEREGKAVGAEVGKVIRGEVDGDLHGNGG